MGHLPPIVAFAAPSGTGKTTLIERVVRVMVGRGLRVGVLKADAHRVVLDTPGKDSWRFADAGASPVAVLSADRLALFERVEGDISLVAAAVRLFPGVDVVLAEGFRRSGVPTIRVHRALGPAGDGWTPPRKVVAWASDSAPETSLPVLPLDRPDRVADWIAEHFVVPSAPRRPTVVCPVADPARLEEAVATAVRLGRGLGSPAMVVAGPGVPATSRPGVSIVSDVRPRLGLLGALFTGLAAAETPEVLLVGPRHWGARTDFLVGLVRRAPSATDVAYVEVDGRPDPALAMYGHRCLSAIQEALLSGEFKMTGWWGQVAAWGRSDRGRLAGPQGLETQ